MTASDDQTLHALLRRARRAEGITQSALAEELACRQSAVSMFESGHTNALAWEKVEHFAARFNIDLSPWTGAKPIRTTATRLRLCYCPAADCPSNVPYMAGSTACFKPRLVTTHDGGQTYCRLCGEVLESRCPNNDCRADVHEGAFCPFCGDPYVSPSHARPHTPAWIAQQRQSITDLYTLTRTEPPLMASTPDRHASQQRHRKPASMESSL